MKKIILLSTLASLLIFKNHCWAQGVAVNSTGNPPDASALLDIDATGMTPQKGLLIPRVTLTSITDAATITTPATSLLVYNTGTGGLAPAGYYYNQGTTGAANWVPFLTNNVNTPSAWSLTGNTGTTASTAAIGSTVTNNFMGTTDAKDFVFASNNLERMRITSGGNVGIGTGAPSYPFQVYTTTAQGIRCDMAGTGSSLILNSGTSNLQVTHDASNFVMLHNSAAGTVATAGIKIQNSSGTADLVTFTNIGNVGIGTTNGCTTNLPFSQREVEKL